MFALSGGAQGGADALQEVLKQKFLEQIQKQQLAQRAAEAEQQREIQMRGLDLTKRGQDQGQYRFDTQRNDALQAADAASQQGAEQAAALEAYIQGLPEHLRPVVAGKAKFGVQVSPDDMVNAPMTREAEQAHRIKGVAGETEARERIQAKYRPAPTPPQPRDERLVQVDGPDGPMWVRESDAVGKRAPRGPKTPEQIEAEAAARARGGVTGKQEAGGGGVIGAITGLFGGGEKKTVVMKAPDGTTKAVPADQVEYYKSLGAVEVR